MSDKELIEKYIEKEKQEDAFLLLKKGYPIQYIIGNVDFYNCIINVNENVLIPRFETEYLVDDLLKLIKKYNFNNPKILDIGTGSGCISIALQKELNTNIEAIDINPKAIELAKQNAKDNSVSILFKVADVNTYDSDKKFDIIVSNPPYVQIGSPVDEKIKYEPQEAIYAPEDGLYFYKVILSKARNLLNKKNIIVFEIGDNQGEIISSFAKEIFPNSKTILKNDLNNYNRYLYIINE